MMIIARGFGAAACLTASGGLLVGAGLLLRDQLANGGGVSLPALGLSVLGVAAFGLVADLVGRGKRGGRNEDTALANSRWANRSDLLVARLFQRANRGDESAAGREGIYVGEYRDATGRLVLRYSGEKHLLTFGAPGANKTMGYIVPNMHLARSMVVLDPKGQIARMAHAKRAALGRVIVINSHGVQLEEAPELESIGWSPTSQLDPASGDAFEDGARCIADALIDKKEGGGNNKFFDISAENLATALIMWERIVNGDRSNLANIRDMVCAPTVYDDKTKKPRAGFLHTLIQMTGCEHATVANIAGRLLGRMTDANSHATSAQDVIDTLLSETAFLDKPAIRDELGQGSTIDFAAFHREITTVFVILPVDQLDSCGKFLRTFVNLALLQLYKNRRPLDGALPPVLFLLDEFANLGRLREINRALTISRDFGIQLWPFVHNVGQLKAHYSAEWNSFFTGAGVKTTFRTGDPDTPELLCKLYGNREEEVPTHAATGGISNTPHAVPLIRPEDVGRLSRGQTIALIEPCDMPIKVGVPLYTETDFADGLAPNPYYRPPA